MLIFHKEMLTLGKDMQEVMPFMASLVCATESSVGCLCSKGQSDAGGHGSHAFNGRPG